MVDKLFWPETPLLESVGQHEPQIDQLRSRVERATSQSLIPLLAYARQYEQYLELMNLDIKAYVRSGNELNANVLCLWLLQIVKC